jgi:glycosyltransferase involved in cell wall biosynthesis
MKELVKPYLLYIGNAYPHKNLERLIFAFKKLVKDGLDYQLVLVGGNDYFYEKLKLEIRNLELEIKDRIIFAGFVPDNDLDILYRNAGLYAFPSLYEGFGLPPLEAMARGVPVVSSNATCLPEILGDAALYFNPLDIDDIAKKIKKALKDENLRKNLIEKGLEQIKCYSWEKMVRKTLNLYK